MAALTKYPEPLVFGLDIGTRSIVGTVGYREGSQFNIVAQSVKFHDTRAMLDGQIHDIIKVGEEIVYVKEQLEKQLEGRKLKEVCIAAAGRVLRTAVGKGTYEFPENTVVNQEHIHALEMLGVEKAYELMLEKNQTDVKFYCVGYTVVKYYLNGYEIGNLEGHKANHIGADVLATFLPEEVVDGLYAAVGQSGLEISNMTLEPIAAMQVAIPENYRLLNIALVDVGAGTSDICITKDGSIIAYGMLPKAGDKLTERLIQEYLVDFATAEKIKMIGPSKKTLTYKDIMGISHKVTPKEVYEKVDAVLEDITGDVAEKIKELNGGKPVSATFVVGGGGKIPGFTEKLAKHLGLPKERVGLRGEEVLGFVNIFVDGVKKDPLLVTPIGICLNFYDQKNRFVFVHVNEDRVKLYDNDKLTVFDAALAYGLTNDSIFPRRGDDLHYTLNGKKKFIRGSSGEAAVIRLNGKESGMNHLIKAGDEIQIVVSTKGENAKAVLGEVADFGSPITFMVNDISVSCPRYASVNGRMESEFYEIAEGDEIEFLNYYTLSQLMQFMDIETPHEVFVNGARAGADTKIYENFNVAWIDKEEIYKAERFVEEEPLEEETDSAGTDGGDSEDLDGTSEKMDNLSAKEETDHVLKTGNGGAGNSERRSPGRKKKKHPDRDRQAVSGEEQDGPSKNQFVNQWLEDMDENENGGSVEIKVVINGTSVTLTGKSKYVFVDIFDFYKFDLKNVKGTRLIEKVDGKKAEHFSPIHNGAVLELYWES